MGKLFLALIILFTLTALAERSPQQEIRCFNEIRDLQCGGTSDTNSFLSCVSLRLQKLSPVCQAYHLREANRES